MLETIFISYPKKDKEEGTGKDRKFCYPKREYGNSSIMM